MNHYCYSCNAEMMFTQGKEYECIHCSANTVSESLIESTNKKD